MNVRILALLFLCAAMYGGAFAEPAAASDKKSTEALLLEAFKAEKAGGDSARIREKFEAVLRADPENYYALVKLGSMQAAEESKGPALSAINYLLRAAVTMPNNPEAFVYLAQLHYSMGYITEGDNYLRMCEGLSRHLVYDSICLLGWRYEDTGNYSAAIMTYASPALSPDSKFMGNPFLTKRLLEAAQMSQRPYDWANEVVRLLFRETGQQIIDLVNNNVIQAFIKNPRLDAFYTPKDAANLILRDLIVSELKTYVALLDRVPEHYEAPSVLYKLLMCSPEEVKQPRFDDPYAAFVAASGETSQEQERVLTALRANRDQALKDAASAKNDEEKARMLYLWLKKNLLKEYSTLEGFSAKSIVDKQKFDSLSGTTLYVLLARDAKLNVKGSLVPGRAFAVMDLDRHIRIDLTAESGEGFDVKGEASEKFRDRDPSLDGTGFDSFAEIENPLELIASLFVDSAVKSVDSLVVDRYQSLFRRVLKEELGLDDTAQTEVVEGLRQQGNARVSGPRGPVNISLTSGEFRRLIRRMASLDSKFRQNLVGQYEKNIPLLKTARQLAPYDAKFRALMDDYIAAAARHEYDAANTGLVNRAASKARAFFATTEPDLPAMLAAAAGSRGPESQTSSQSTAVVEEEARILAEERQNWPNERKAWIAALNRVAAAAKQNPCDDRLRQALAAIYVRGLAMAERRQDAGAVDEIKRIAGALLP